MRLSDRAAWEGKPSSKLLLHCVSSPRWCWCPELAPSPPASGPEGCPRAPACRDRQLWSFGKPRAGCAKEQEQWHRWGRQQDACQPRAQEQRLGAVPNSRVSVFPCRDKEYQILGFFLLPLYSFKEKKCSALPSLLALRSSRLQFCDLTLKCFPALFCSVTYRGFSGALQTHRHTQMTQEGVGQ